MLSLSVHIPITTACKIDVLVPSGTLVEEYRLNMRHLMSHENEQGELEQVTSQVGERLAPQRMIPSLERAMYD